MRGTRSLLLGAALAAVAVVPTAGWARETPTASPRPVPATLDVAAGREAADRCLAWLVAHQRDNGAWGHAIPGETQEAFFAVETHYTWQIAASALANLALLYAPATPERDAALERGLHWLATNRMPRRGNEWDTDYMWSALYGVVATVTAYDSPRITDNAKLREALAARGRAYVAVLVANQAPLGGWAYYDDPPWTSRNKWATSFCTSLVLPYLARAQALGWLEDGGVVPRAVHYVEKCRLPNGAYQYSLDVVPWITGGESINDVKGSLGRIQVSNWALNSLGRKSVGLAELRTGLTAFFQHHRFLDTARLRPIPHEGHYYNAGYFYNFGHYYAAKAISRLPADEQEAWHARLRPHVVKTLRADGSTSDFLGADYMLVASTAYCAMALELGLPHEAAESYPSPEGATDEASEAPPVEDEAAPTDDATR
ncbi:MAG: hypothetical protein H6806_00295 [Planctomycetes bacterium]|nr:hypothetical protein [Planctomycetota bacterium]MCB9828184.1 hypothetical protein [Planctomycetota bacterium]